MATCLLVAAVLALGQAEPPAPAEVAAPLLPLPAPPAPAPTPAPPPAPTPDRWLLLKELQGTWYGGLLDGNRMALYGWAESSFTGSTAAVTNEPMTWNDRANRLLLQQFFLRLERTVVTSGTTEPTFGFRTDWIVGTDYRFTMARGVFNSQLANANGTQNLYGVDPVEFYGEAYFPTVLSALDVKVGRFYCPFGEESNEAVSTPLASRSYTFTTEPFTHFGVLALLNVNPEWSVHACLVNGNDMVFDDGQELRFIGRVQWTQPGGRNTIAFGTAVGRGKFNPGAPNAAATVATATEPFGRNNLNVFDLVYTHTFSPVLSYTLETAYGYTTNVPPAAAPGLAGRPGGGTAAFASAVNYLFYTLSPRLAATTRLEFFDDFQGQRTGSEGLYTAATAGVQFRPRKDVILRPELRYDHNGESQPFEGKHDLFTATMDVIVRW
jgi:hypothetical protein